MKPGPRRAERWYWTRERWRGAAMASALLCWMSACYAPAGQAPPQRQGAPGELDLRDWDPSSGPVRLEGNWGLYWNALVGEGQGNASEAPAHIHVPCRWNRAQPGPASRPGAGAATYALDVLLPQRPGALALRMPEPNLASRVFVNGRLVGGRGQPARNAARERGASSSYVVALDQTGRRLSLRIEQSNHGTRTGGLGEAPLLGEPDRLWAAQTHGLLWTALLVGLLVGVALYHLGIYSLSRSVDAHLILALYCLAVAVHTTAVDTNALTFALGREPPWWLSLRIEYLALYASVPLGLLLGSRLFPEETANTPMRVSKWLGLGFLLLPATLPVELYSRTLLPFSAMALCTVSVLMVCIAAAARRRRPHAGLILSALVLYVVANLHDVLATHGAIESGVRLGALSMLFFLGSQAWSLSKDYADKQAEVSRLSRSLSKTNHDLVRTNQSIRRFVPREVLALLDRRSITEVQHGDHTGLTMHVLFCDIRDFTPMVEAMPEREAFRFVNEYLTFMEPAILEQGGFINQYLGDCIMALFPGEADAAVQAALDMLARLAEFNRIHRSGQPPVQVGIGIHTGPLMLGAIGGKERLDSGVVGDAVNVAARIESMTKRYRASLIISEATLERMRQPERFELRELGEVVPKGRSQAVQIFQVAKGSRRRRARPHSRRVARGDLPADEPSCLDEGLPAALNCDTASMNRE